MIEEVVELLEDYKFIDVVRNPNPKYSRQYVFVLEYQDYFHSVRCVLESEDIYFIKTIFRDRKLKKQYNKE